MKILWITNNPIAAAKEKYKMNAISGTWTEPALLSLKENKDVDIYIASVAKCKGIDRFTHDNIKYICLPVSKRKIYPHNSKRNLKLWKKVIEEVNPDLIMIWGTEYAHSYCALKVSKGIPSIIFIQGILDSISRYYLGGMSDKELREAYTFRNFLKRDSIKQQQRLFARKAEIEREMLNLSGRVINELNWAQLWCKRIAPNSKNYVCPLSISDAFSNKEWNFENCVPHSIFCCAPNLYPLKGFHILLKAMALVVKEYPDAKIRVPGMRNPLEQNKLKKFKRQGYVKYLVNLIKRLGLEKNIEFLGVLSPEQMATEMANANLFVIPSSIENHSSSLREAMLVGTPSVASFVGGIPETVINGENALVYRFEEYECLADSIMNIFSKPELAKKLSSNARKDMSKLVSNNQNAQCLYDIYKEILSE